MYFDNYTCNTDPLTSQYFDLCILIFIPKYRQNYKSIFWLILFWRGEVPCMKRAGDSPKIFSGVCRDGPEPSRNPAIRPILRPILAPGLCMFRQTNYECSAFLCGVTSADGRGLQFLNSRRNTDFIEWGTERAPVGLWGYIF